MIENTCECCGATWRTTEANMIALGKYIERRYPIAGRTPTLDIGSIPEAIDWTLPVTEGELALTYREAVS